MTIILKSQQTIACTSFHVTPPMHGNEANLHDNHAILKPTKLSLIDKSIEKKKVQQHKVSGSSCREECISSLPHDTCNPHWYRHDPADVGKRQNESQSFQIPKKFAILVITNKVVR